MHDRLNTLWARLLIGWGIPLILFLAVAGVASVVIARLVDALAWENHSYEVIAMGMIQEEHLTQMRLAVYRIGVEGVRDFQEKWKRLHSNFTEVNAELQMLVKDDPVQRQRIERLADLEGQWQQKVLRDVPLLRRKPGQSREEYEAQMRRFVDHQELNLQAMDEESHAFLEHEHDLLRERRQNTLEENRYSLLLIGITSALGLFFTFLLIFQTVRGVTAPIHKLRQASAQFLEGRFKTVAPFGPTEIAELITHFNHMALTLLDRTATLKASEERYRTYIGAISQLLWVSNADGEVTEDLPTWRAYTGQQPEALRGLGWLDAVHEQERAQVEGKWREAVQSRQPFEVETRLRRGDGAYRHFHCRAVPVVAETGEVREWMGTCVDITEQKESAALLQAKEAAEAANRAKSEFLAKMSHELRTPLNAIIGMSKMLGICRFGPLTAKQADYLADITAAGEHLLDLINGVLDLTKVEAGKMEVHAEPFSPNETAAFLVESLRPLAESKNVSLDCDLPEEGALQSDRSRFRQILYNLLSNALKFTPPRGKVTVRARWLASAQRGARTTSAYDARAIRFTVHDTGVGISREEQPRIWEEFHQVRDDSLQSVEGTGLGLALTRRLVQLLRGDIWLESEMGQGSAFHFILPIDFNGAALPLMEQNSNSNHVGRSAHL